MGHVKRDIRGQASGKKLETKVQRSKDTSKTAEGRREGGREGSREGGKKERQQRKEGPLTHFLPATLASIIPGTLTPSSSLRLELSVSVLVAPTKP